MLSAYSRMTYSLAVVMMETTASINIFFPMFLVIMVSRVVAGWFTPSLYQVTIKNKSIPILPKRSPKAASEIALADVMNTEICSITTICTAQDMSRALSENHRCYPVKNTAGRLVGLIPTHMLVCLIKNNIFYDQTLIEGKISDRDSCPEVI